MKKNGRMKKGAINSAKEVARIAVFVAALIGVQYVFAAVPFVELVSLLFSCYAYVFGAVRGGIAAVAFALLRQLLFGFYPVVLVLYLVYFPVLCLAFGLLKRMRLQGWKLLILAVIFAIFCTFCFTILDNVLTPLYNGYTPKAAKLYFKASIPFMIGQTVCVAISVAILFLPLTKAMALVKKM